MMDEKFLDALADVVWRFRVYDQYGKDPRKAIKALSKRAPGQTPEFYRESFELDLKILSASIEAVNEAPKSHKPGQVYSEYSDVDLDFVLSRLHDAFPDQSTDHLNRYLGMVIFWYYLK